MKDLTSADQRPEFQEEVIDLRHYWRVLMQHKWNIAALSFVVTLLTVLVVFSMTPVFKASTTVLIESEQAKVLSIEDVYGLNTTNKEYFLTQFEILKSRDLAERVIRRLKLDTHPLFDPRQRESGFSLRALIPVDDDEAPLTEQEIFDDVFAQFNDALSIEPVRNTQLVKINFESADPKLAAAITNTLADVFIESYMEAKLSATRKAADWLGERLGDLRDTLQASEERLQDYRESAELVDVQGVQTMGAEELEQLTQRYVEARRNLTELQNIAEQVQSLGGSPTIDQLMAIPSVLRHPLVQSLKQSQAEAERKVAELSKRYGPKHPKMKAAMSESSQALGELKRQVQRVGSGLQADYRAAMQTERTFAAQLDDAKKRLQGINRKEFKLRELEREVQTNRQLYDMFMKRAKETDEAGGLQAAHARVIDPAVAPRLPVKPKKALIALLAMVASGMLGVMLAFLQDALNNTVRTPDDVDEKLRAPMLGFLPLVKSNKSEQAFEGFLSDGKSNFAEAIRTIRTGLMLSNLDEPHKITVITSSVPNEGKSTVSLNLAEAVGQMEKVLLIDADMRRPTLAKTIGLPRSAPGLSNLVAGTADFKDCVHKLPNSTVDVITAGVVPGNPLELLSSKRFAQVLQKLSERYDRILIDSAPTHAVSDAMVLSTYADALVYVVKADDTAAPLAAKGINRLKEVGATITGVVLNQVDVEKTSNYGSYYAGYYQGYGYTSEEEAA
ncbi:polysaccharide biosynthesis tyrosine autokinase [Aestuariicella hydrocarbonica]|uniref:non-specific protein-tyrosine kinase n=1 Tax=Pseudomaricurvus hydrocarbonicus TaxID=1470433 RepID=A0A9E5T381_9GAMM|nr:polysaccharide biosynthesis tyrosine autokinase [Aestuariicella hydrocarbonica]NHO68521.1 polysaccharide biosynthesis tyrosine autokinase [Aestuariicella hydrocarbonica]